MFKTLEIKADTFLASLTSFQHGNTKRYLIASIIVLASLLFRIAIAPVNAGLPFLTFFPAVTLAALLSGFGPGLFAMMACSILASYMFFPPFNSFPLTFSPEIIWANAVFYLEESLVIIVIHAMFRQHSNYLLATNKLHDSDALNASILNSLTAQIAVLDTQGVIVAVNSAWRRFAKENGLPESNQNLLGFNYLDACKNAVNQPCGDEASAAQIGIARVLAGELDTFQLEYPCHSPNQQRWFHMTVLPLQGSRHGVVISHENITERKLAKQKLQDNERMLSESQNIAHIGSWSIDLATGSLSWSDEMYRICGVNKETFELSAKNFLDLIHPNDRDEMENRLNNCLAGIEPKEQDFRIQLSGGSVRVIRSSGGLLYDENEQPFRIAGTVQDITERLRRERQAKQHLNELAHVTRLGLMGELASGIAHEVNQPMAAISNYAQACLNLINTENPDLAKLAEILDKSQQQASRAALIIKRMREFIKSDAKERSAADINSLIRDCVDLCVAELKQNNIKIKLELGSNLPPLYVDRIQIEQVIINLIKNSADALGTLPEKQQCNLTIHTQLTPDNSIQVRIKDNGPGLTEEQKHKILLPFYTTKTEGMGMGLSISRSLIEAHDGTLDFNSQSGKGTTFYFTLPIQAKSDNS